MKKVVFILISLFLLQIQFVTAQLVCKQDYLQFDTITPRSDSKKEYVLDIENVSQDTLFVAIEKDKYQLLSIGVIQGEKTTRPSDNRPFGYDNRTSVFVNPNEKFQLSIHIKVDFINNTLDKYYEKFYWSKIPFIEESVNLSFNRKDSRSPYKKISVPYNLWIKPNLVFEDVTFSNKHPNQGDIITIVQKIRNQSTDTLKWQKENYKNSLIYYKPEIILPGARDSIVFRKDTKSDFYDSDVSFSTYPIKPDFIQHIKCNYTVQNVKLYPIALIVVRYQYKELIEGDKSVYEYEIKNVGTSDLFIYDVKSSCGCLSPKWSKKPIPPNGSAKIIGVYNSRPGPFNKTLSVRTNSVYESKIQLIVAGNVSIKEK